MSASGGRCGRPVSGSVAVLAFSALLAAPAAAQTVAPRIETVVGTGMGSFSGDGGAATSATIRNPNGVALDSAGNLYIGDSSNHRIRRVDTAGNISTIAGTGTNGFSSGGGTATSAQLDFPNGLVVDSAGDLYFADENNHRIRRVDAAGNISTFAGTGAGGIFGAFGGDGGPATAAAFRYPPNIALDSAGNLYIADYGNRRVRKVDAAGNISTIAGTGAAGFSGDGGPATAAPVDGPTGVVFDSAGNLYISDTNNHRIRKVDPSGNISTIAGTGSAGFGGDGGQATAAQINFPRHVALDGAGNLYIADASNHRIRRIDASGIISTVAGTGTGGFGGDGGAPTSAQINDPRGIAVDSASRYIYIADSDNHRIRRISGVAEPAPPPEEEGQGGAGAPEVVAAPGIVTLPVGGSAEVDLSRVFRDPDSDALSYSAVSTNPRVATATVAGSVLRIFGVRTGNVAIAVTAEDPQGLTARADVRVGVIGTACSTAPAQAPEGRTATVVAELAAAAESSTTVRWRVVPDSNPATANADAGEHGGASGEVEIQAGDRCADIEIPILDDADAEPAREWFAVEMSLRNGGEARLTRSTVQVAVLEGVCDRTRAVRRALLAATDKRGCEEPAPADLRRVWTLDLDGAGLSAFATEDLGGLTGLRRLDLTGNALTGLPALPEATRLERLLLGGNALESVPLDALPAPERLRGIVLSDNALADLPADAFASVPGLRSLRLDGNDLRALPDGLFAGLGSLRLLRLDGNPGAPFALPVKLERMDAEPWAPPPATLQAAMPLGAPFETMLGLAAEGGTFADGSAESSTTVPAGETASATFTLDSATGFARASLTVPELPDRLCMNGPCWQGFALKAGAPLPLFARPPQALAAPEPETLLGEGLRVALSSLAEPGEPGDQLEWSVRSSDASVATARVADGALLVEPQPGAEGTVMVEATATDANGQTATVRFEVHVEFHWPTTPTRGWRGIILNGQP